MRVLLDTHALLWWRAGDEQLSARAKHTIAHRANTVFVSAASAWEITTKYRLGKLPGIGPLAVDFQREVEQQGFAPLAISIGHAQLAGSLSGAHRDPVDRMLIAQAREEKMALVSIERLFDEYDVRRVW